MILRQGNRKQSKMKALGKMANNCMHTIRKKKNEERAAGDAGHYI
jgi:hypothetical protein